MHKIALCGLLSLCSAGVVRAESLRPSLERRHLDTSAEIQGYACENGVAWFYDNGALESCRTGRDTSFGEARVPAGSWIHLTSDGKPRFVFLHHNTRVNQYACRGEGHGFTTAFYPSGKLKECWLAEDQEIQAVHCMRGGFFGDVFGGGSSVRFYENGRLRRCKISKPATIQGARFPRGAHVVFDENGRVH